MPGNREIVDEVSILALVREALDDVIQHGLVYSPRGRSEEVERVHHRCDLDGILLRKQATAVDAHLSADEVIGLNKVAASSEMAMDETQMKLQAFSSSRSLGFVRRCATRCATLWKSTAWRILSCTV